MALFEPEETVGKYWHRLIGRASTYPRHPEAAVPLDSMRTRIGVMFRALGEAAPSASSRAPRWNRGIASTSSSGWASAARSSIAP